MLTTEEQSVKTKIRRMAIALYSVGALLVLVSALAIGGYVIHNNEPAPYDPLGNYDTQVVTAETLLNDGRKAVYIDDLVEVSGTKCNDSNEEVEIEGSLNWKAVDPPGISLESGKGFRIAIPGCTNQTFENIIPQDVEAAIRKQHANGIEYPVWRIQGIEYPIDENGERGFPRRFETENFVVLLEEQ